MREYRVRWEIDIEADTPEEAAALALAIQRKPDSIATVFDVWEHGTPMIGNSPVDFQTFDLTPAGCT